MSGKSSQKRIYEVASSSHQDVEEPRRSKRAKVSKTFGSDYLAYMLENEPNTLKELMSTPEVMFQKKVVNGEIKSIMKNHTWELVDLPPNNKPLACKWIFKMKLKVDGLIDKYKSRLVSKGF